jgi:murein DD-endopeptidase MepM/ murein hydrolase activator NlpD
VIVFSLIAKFRTLAGVTAAAATLFGANPAFANSSAATADIAAPLRAAQAEKQSALGAGDEEFRTLFASWQSLEKPQSASFAAASSVPGISAIPMRRISTAVSIPSRMPVEGVHLTSSYGMRWHPVLGGRRAHKGVDLAGPIGTPVHATADAVVGKAEWFSSYGLYVQLEHGADIETRYGHMSRLNVAAGQHVRKGDVIGYIGTTGRSTGPHLHYEVRIAGVAVNPIPYMQAGEVLAANTSSTETGQGGPE